MKEHILDILKVLKSLLFYQRKTSPVMISLKPLLPLTSCSQTQALPLSVIGWSNVYYGLGGRLPPPSLFPGFHFRKWVM